MKLSHSYALFQSDGVATDCFCQTDNCNANNCKCTEPYKCQQCGTLENGFKCTDKNDNGKSAYCPTFDGMTCFKHVYGKKWNIKVLIMKSTLITYLTDNGETYRGCTIKSGNETCFESAGDGSMKCECTTENCNKDENCSCGAAALILSSITIIAVTFIKLL